MEPYDFEQAAKDLSEKFEGAAYHIDEKDVLSEALYPSGFADYMEHRLVYDDVGHLPTHVFLRPMALNDEVEFEDGHGRAEYVELSSISELDDKTCSRRVVFSVNGEAWQFRVTDEEAMTIASGGGAGSARKMRRKASSSSGDVGAPMPGVVVDVKVGEGDVVSKGETLFVLSAMKMESTIVAPAAGTVTSVLCAIGDNIEAEDLLATLED